MNIKILKLVFNNIYRDKIFIARLDLTPKVVS